MTTDEQDIRLECVRWAVEFTRGRHNADTRDLCADDLLAVAAAIHKFVLSGEAPDAKR